MSDTREYEISPDIHIADIERPMLERALAGRYRIVRLLGRGGMGAVYLAWEHALERMVAIKVLTPALGGGIEHRERFRREARTAALLAHPNVVPLHAFGDANGTPYFVMSYVRGESLAERLKRERRLSAAETCRILAELADALDFAHRHGIVHRDIKPENILLDAETGRPMLTDFGVATVFTSEHSRAEASKSFGTPQYMSPEQAMGESEFDGRSDIYALGVLGYLMLTGHLPFDGRTFQELAAQHVTKEPLPPSMWVPMVPDSVAAIVLRCLAKDPSGRWPNAKSLSVALALDGLSRGALTYRASGVWSPRSVFSVRAFLHTPTFFRAGAAIARTSKRLLRKLNRTMTPAAPLLGDAAPVRHLSAISGGQR